VRLASDALPHERRGAAGGRAPILRASWSHLSALLATVWIQGCGAPGGTNAAVAPRATAAESEPAERTGLPAGRPTFPLDSDGRIARATLHRLDIVTGFEEVRPGLLRLRIGKGWMAASAEYHLSHLFGGYAAQLGPDRKPVMELWQGGRKIGEYTVDGLLIGAEFSTPR